MQFPSLTPLELAAAGKGLFGAHWRSELALALGVSEADIAAIEAGAASVPPEWRVQLIAVAQDVSMRALRIASELMWDETRAEAAAARSA